MGVSAWASEICGSVAGGESRGGLGVLYHLTWDESPDSGPGSCERQQTCLLYAFTVPDAVTSAVAAGPTGVISAVAAASPVALLPILAKAPVL